MSRAFQLISENPAKFFHFRLDHIFAVRHIPIPIVVVLVVVFRFVEHREGDDLGYDGFGIRFFFVDLFDVVFRLLFLLRIVIKDGGTILGTHVVPLPVQ